MTALPRVIVLMGPTASGKTALGVDIAKALDGEVISVDSALVYRGMDIGTAKPDMEERQGIKHHLIDLLDPSESFSAGQFREQAVLRDKLQCLAPNQASAGFPEYSVSMEQRWLVDLLP